MSSAVDIARKAVVISAKLMERSTVLSIRDPISRRRRQLRHIEHS